MVPVEINKRVEKLHWSLVMQYSYHLRPYSLFRRNGEARVVMCNEIRKTYKHSGDVQFRRHLNGQR